MKSLSSRPHGHVFLTSAIAQACLEAGQVQRAEALIAEALEVASLPFGAFYAPEAQRVAAECRLRAFDVVGAREALRRAKARAWRWKLRSKARPCCSNARLR